MCTLKMPPALFSRAAQVLKLDSAVVNRNFDFLLKSTFRLL